MADNRSALGKTTDAVPFNDKLILLAWAIGQTKEQILAHPEKYVTLSTYFRFRHLLFRRKRGWPIAYLTGHKEFFGLDFIVNRHTLIPRPETELIVEIAGNEIKKNKANKIILIDVGTGTGCIPISILKKYNGAAEQANNITAFASDISRAALRVAKHNAKIHKVKITFLPGNLLKPAIHYLNLKNLQPTTLIITANLPYLTAEQYAAESTIKKEPRSALVAENNGLALYEKLFQQLRAVKQLNNQTIIVEIDPDQSAMLQTMIKKNFPTASAEIKKDLAGRDRAAVIWLS